MDSRFGLVKIAHLPGIDEWSGWAGSPTKYHGLLTEEGRLSFHETGDTARPHFIKTPLI